MPTPADRLEAAYRELMAADGPAFLARLRDYERVLREDWSIRRAVRRLEKRVGRAEKQFDRNDESLIRELKTLRHQLVQRVPEADDSDVPYPAADGQPAPARSLEGHEWAHTLANFDAVAKNRDDRLIVHTDLDASRSGMLAAILDSKLTDVRFPRREPTPGVMTRVQQDQRRDLVGLHRGVQDACRRQRAAYRALEQELEDVGYIGLHRIRETVKGMRPEYLPMNTPAETNEAFNETLRDVTLGYHHLRQAVRPAEVRGELSDDAKNAVAHHEEACREAVGRVHPRIREQLGSRARIPRWGQLSAEVKATILIGVLTIAAAIAIAIATS